MSSDFLLTPVDFSVDKINLPVHWVKTDDELYRLIDEIDDVDVVALDTEFIKRDTFFPILALIQINTGRGIYLVDAPRLDLHDLWQALIDVPWMIWYACGEDLGIFYLLADCPPLTNVIDVQIGVAYLTGNLQVGFARAVSEVLSVELSKTESQSDWLVRPLSEEQERYAVDDVRYLLVLHEAIEQQLRQKNLWQMVVDDSTYYAHELHAREHTQADELYLNYVAPNYNHEQITVLQAVVAWREQLARAINRPRTFILGKQALRDVVETLPKTMRELSATTMNRTAIRLYGDELLKIIASAKKSQERPNLPLIYSSKDKPFKNKLKDEIALYAQTHGIPAVLLLKNRWMDELLQLVALHDYGVVDDVMLQNHLPIELLGYRFEWIKQVVLPLLYQYRPEIQEAMELIKPS